MILPPGQSSGESGNEHPRCEQWLFVVSGSGRATVNMRRLLLRPQSLLVIEKGEVHQVVNTGAVPLRTINLYIPPAYEKNGAVKTNGQVGAVMHPAMHPGRSIFAALQARRGAT